MSIRSLMIFVYLLAVLAVTGAACSPNNLDKRWDYKEGFVVAKESGRILVVRD